jgi:DDE superfamily endonuclease/Helix-turn-helix of DDE superfamily endonuclease
MLFYRAALPLSSRTLRYAAGIIRRHRKSIGSRWRKLNPGQQALLVLAYLRKGETFAELAAGFRVGTTTAWRYMEETIALLAARAPKLRMAARDAKKAGHAYVVVDGTLIPIDRVAADRPFYSGKHKKHGMNLQVIASPAGDILWVSGALPGSVHDKKAEWIWGVLAELEAAGLIVLADKGYQGSTYAKTPYKGRNKPQSQKDANRAHAKLRAPGERANAQLKTWKVLQKLRCCPWKAGQLAKAIHRRHPAGTRPGDLSGFGGFTRAGEPVHALRVRHLARPELSGRPVRAVRRRRDRALRHRAPGPRGPGGTRQADGTGGVAAAPGQDPDRVLQGRRPARLA